MLFSLHSRFLGRVLVLFSFAVGLAAGVYWIDGLPRFLSQHPRSVPQPAPRQITTIPPGQKVIGYIDMTSGQPVISAAQGEAVAVSGWAACAALDSPLAKVEILVDGQTMANTTADVPRPDVAESFARSDFARSGWQSTFSSSRLKPGERALSVRATCAKGESGVLPPFQLVVKPASQTAPAGQ